MEYQELIEGRYSVRKFKDEPLSEAQLQAVLEAGRIAPTARNSQPQRIWVVTKPEDLEKVDACSPCRFNAPAVLIVGYSTAATGNHPDPLHGDWSYGLMDSSIVLTHMMLKAHDLGLGSCWVGLFDSAKTQAAFGLPEDITVIGFLPIGHPADDATPANMHFRRKALEETVVWL